jgi:hypothetical protein
MPLAQFEHWTWIRFSRVENRAALLRHFLYSAPRDSPICVGLLKFDQAQARRA